MKNNETKEENTTINIKSPTPQSSYNIQMMDAVNRDPQVFSTLNKTQQADLTHDLQKTHGNQYVQRLIKSQNEQTNEILLQTEETANSTLEDKNNQELLDELKEDAENLFGSSLDDMPIHHDSIKPEEIDALDYTQETDTYATPSTLFQTDIQPRLKIGPIDDPLEREADEVAEHVLRMPEPESASIDEFVSQKLPIQQIQTKTSPTPTTKASPQFESELKSLSSSGVPLDTSSRDFFEPRFRQDFSDVRVHTGTDAVQMSSHIGAQAFTQGNNIYFNEGKYNPESKQGQHLIAHELVHTIQQGNVQKLNINDVQRKLSDIGPNPNVPVDKIEPSFDGKIKKNVDEVLPSKEGKIEKYGENYKLILKEFKLKKYEELFLKDKYPEFELPKGERSTRQISKWKKEIKPKVKKIITEKTGQNEPSDTKYMLSAKNNPTVSMGGTVGQLADAVSIPSWSNGGNLISYQVEHIIDWQIAGGNVGNGVDNIENLILLEDKVNNALGQKVKKLKNQHIENVLNHYKEAGVTQKVDEAVKNYKIIIETHSATPCIPVAEPMLDRLEITNPTHTKYPFNESLIDIRNFEVPKDHFLLKTSQRGVGFIIPYAANGYKTGNFTVGVTGDVGKHHISSITLSPIVDKGCISISDVSTYEVEKKDTDIFMVKNLRSKLKNLFELKMMSPIIFEEDDIDIVCGMNLYGIGKVKPTIPFIENADIDIVIEGDNVRLRKIFNGGELKLPAPFRISDTSLEVSIGTEGLGIGGKVNFSIDNVGEGYVGGATSTSGSFELVGAFNFDSKLFNPANINVEYKNNIWKIGGEVGIPENKIKGIKKATIKTSYSENNFKASGDAELDIPGIQRGSMNATFNNDGFSIGGNFQLANNIPGIAGGNVSAEIAKKTGEEDYQVKVSGTAQPKIPGINSTLSVEYDNGALTIAGSANYNKGMLGGTVNIIATNRSIGDDGQPTGNPDKEMRIYGGGSLTLKLTPWLQAKADVKFSPEGEIEVTGEIGLPSTVDVFKRKSIDQKLFSMPAIEIPIFAIPLGPRSIGLVARITGGLDLSAGFGPGQLQELYVTVTYNPSREEDTTIAGKGKFVIPASAGLRLSSSLGLGVSVTIASLTGGIEIAGTLGLEGEAVAGVDVNWNHQTGLALDAEGKITVNPQFKFDINAMAQASLDLFVKSLSKTWRYNLASFSWGPDIQFGIMFPIHYRENEPFNMSYEDLKVIYPNLDIGGMAKGLAIDVKDRMFGKDAS